MSVITAPVTDSRRRSITVGLTLIVLATLLVVGLIVVGAPLLRLPATVLVPTLELEETWDADTIAGLSAPRVGDVGPDGNLYVVNGGSGEILVLSPQGSIVRRWGEPGTEPGQLGFRTEAGSIGGVAVASDGTVYVAETPNRRVQGFSTAGEPSGQWGTEGFGDGQFQNPIGVAVGPDGDVYVVDDVLDRIQRFSADGTHVNSFGSRGSANGQMLETGSIAVAVDGTLFNADFGNGRVQSWDSNGEFCRTISEMGVEVGQLAQPHDVDLDRDGNVYVTDTGRVQVFTREGRLLSVYPIPGMDLVGSIHIAVADDGLAYVSTHSQDRILRLAIVPRERSQEVALAPTPEPPSSASAGPPSGPPIEANASPMGACM